MTTEILAGIRPVTAADTSRWHNLAMIRVGKDVFRRRKRLRFSQERLAKAAGVDKETVGRVERDDESVKPVTVQLVLDALAQAEAVPLGHTLMASSVLTQEASPHVGTSPAHVTFSPSVINEIAALASRILQLLGTAQYSGGSAVSANPQATARAVEAPPAPVAGKRPPPAKQDR